MGIDKCLTRLKNIEANSVTKEVFDFSELKDDWNNGKKWDYYSDALKKFCRSEGVSFDKLNKKYLDVWFFLMVNLDLTQSMDLIFQRIKEVEAHKKSVNYSHAWENRYIRPEP